MKNPFTNLVKNVSQKFSNFTNRVKAKMIEPKERIKDRQRSSAGGGGTAAAKVAIDEKAKAKSGYFYSARAWQLRKARRKMARRSRRINRLRSAA